MSIDRYPSLDATEEGIQLLPGRHEPGLPPLRWPGQLAELPIGAASLLAENADDLWPAFRGADLRSVSPEIRISNLALDGATIPDVAEIQLPALPPPGGRELVTLTIGGNDLLMAYANSGNGRALDRAAGLIADEYAALLAAVHERLPSARIVLTTVYDPSDGTGYIPDFHEAGDPLPLTVLHRFNSSIRSLARARRWARLADAHAHFMGHGASAAVDEGWYWQRSMIEPGARGASELRRLWLTAAAPSG
jgi:lysophospholipase L1-like esterase